MNPKTQKETDFGAVWAFLKKYWFHFAIAFAVLMGCAFRLEVYLMGREFWHDEFCLAANFVEKGGFLWVFKHLDYGQLAPAFFLLMTKILTVFFGKSECVLRIIPFVSSIASVFLFLILSLKFLKTKKAVIFANCLFAVNFPLIRYACEFKQYSSDVLFFLILALLMFKIDFEKFGTKAYLLTGFAFALLFFTSQPTCFFLFGIILFNILKKRPKVLYAAIFPAIAVLIYKFTVPKNLDDIMYCGYWEAGFLSFKTIVPFIKESFSFFHYGQKYLAFASPLCIIGFFAFLFRKEQAAKIILFALLGLFFASVLRQYPAFGRVVLFLIPILIIFIGTSLDFELKKFNKINRLVSVGIILCGLCFPILYGGKFICKNSMALLESNSPKSTAAILKNEIGKNDFLIVPKKQKPYYIYYSHILGLKIEKEKLIIYDKHGFKNITEVFEPENIYYIYVPDDYKSNPKIPELERALENGLKEGVVKKYETKAVEKNSHLYKIFS